MTEDIAALQALPEQEPTGPRQFGRVDLCAFSHLCNFITCIITDT